MSAVQDLRAQIFRLQVQVLDVANLAVVVSSQLYLDLVSPS